MASNKRNETTFTEDNQPIKRRGKSTRTKILEAMERQGVTEEGFYDLLITKAFNPESDFSFNELLKRMSPIPKQVAPMVNFDFPQNARPHEQAEAVMLAVSNGVIPPDIGATFVNSIKHMIEIEESTDLKDRIKKLEESLGIE